MAEFANQEEARWRGPVEVTFFVRMIAPNDAQIDPDVLKREIEERGLAVAKIEKLTYNNTFSITYHAGWSAGDPRTRMERILATLDDIERDLHKAVRVAETLDLIRKVGKGERND